MTDHLSFPRTSAKLVLFKFFSFKWVDSMFLYFSISSGIFRFVSSELYICDCFFEESLYSFGNEYIAVVSSQYCRYHCDFCMARAATPYCHCAVTVGCWIPYELIICLGHTFFSFVIFHVICWVKTRRRSHHNLFQVLLNPFKLFYIDAVHSSIRQRIWYYLLDRCVLNILERNYDS